MERGLGCGRNSGDRPDVPETERSERGEPEAADRLRDVDERVAVGRVAVGHRVGERAHADGIEHHDEGAPHPATPWAWRA